MELVKIFEPKFTDLIANRISPIQLDSTETFQSEPSDIKQSWQTENSKNLTCSYCRVEFADTCQQRDHYKLDWHRYNLKQNLLAREPLNEEQFNSKLSDDLSSISGSDSEKEENLDTLAIAQGKIFLKTETGKVFSLYRCLLVDRKVEIEPEKLGPTLQNINLNNQWTILMLGGGHFAGAVFNGENPILHKTFHCYTVRAGQGGSQSSRDNKNASSAPKSAGASLRRYNENALVQHVQDIVENWRKEIAASSLVICRAAGPYNRSVLFGGKTPLLDKSDPRIRTIPFSTRRATFTEVKRVHSVLATVFCYNSLEDATKQFIKHASPEKDSRRGKSKNSSINRAKSREVVARPLPGEASDSSDSEDSKQSTNKPFELESKAVEISFQDELQPFEDSLTPEERKAHGRKKPAKKSKTQKLQEREALRKKELRDVISNGDLETLKNILKTYEEDTNEVSQDKNKVNQDKNEAGIKEVKDNKTVKDNKRVKDIKNEKENKDVKGSKMFVGGKVRTVHEPLDENGNSMLHLACISEKPELISFLLDNNADLCLKNSKQQTPYSCMQSKEIREFLKTYALQNPDKFNYNKAQIPLPTSTLTPEEIAEKKRLQKKAKREKEKEKKKEKEVVRKEQEEQQRFINLTDREKRALAAERRILNQAGAVIARCFLCGSDMAGKVPFEYLGNRFCTIDCLKAHRMKSPIVLS